MADRAQRLAIVVTAQDLAAGKLSNVRKELAQMGTAGKLASVGLGGVMLVGNKAGQALGNLRNRLTSLAGPLGFIGVTAGLFSLTGAVEQGIAKADDMALAVEKLTGVTGMAVHPASQLVAVFGKFGIETDRVVTIAGFAEKTLGKLAGATAAGGKAAKSAALQQLELQKAQRQAHGQSTKNINKLISEQKARDQLTASMANAADGTTKLTALDQKYGLHLVNSKGKVVDFGTELNQVADFYNSNASAAEKATVAAQLFGKGYVALIPVLKLGSKGIAEVAAEADKLGLTLKTAQDVQNVHDFIAAQRDAKEAIGGLEVQLGLLVMPDLTAGFRGLSTFLRDHQDDVKAFFRNGLTAAEGVASFITGTVVPTISGLAGAATGFWNSIPGPLRDFMVKGFVADRTIKFLFGMSPGHLVLQLGEQAVAKSIGGALGGLLGRGASPANPVFVSGGGLGGPGLLTGAAGEGGFLAAAGGVAGIGTIVALAAPFVLALLPAALWDLSHPNQTFSSPDPNRPGGFNPQLRSKGQGWETAGPGLNSARIRSDFIGLQTNSDRIRSDFIGLATSTVAPLTGIASTLTALQQQLHADFADAIHALRRSTDPAAIVAAAKRVTEDMWKGVGSGKTTKSAIADLTAKRDLLLAGGFKADAALITAEIRKLSPLVAGREHQRQLLAQGAKVAASNESVKQKVADLKGIESTLLSEHRTTAASTIAHLIDIVNAVKGIQLPAINIGAYPPSGSGTGNTGATPGPTPAVLGPGHHLAAGGPAAAHHAYRVGEHGEETLVMGDQSGRVIPHAGRFAASMVFVSNWPADLRQAAASGAATAQATSAIARETAKQTNRNDMAAALKAIKERAIAAGHLGRAGEVRDTYRDDLEKGYSLDRIIHALPLKKKAAGGPVWRDHDFLVGERGPELFRPKRDGLIIPNHELRRRNPGGDRFERGPGGADLSWLGSPTALIKGLFGWLGGPGREPIPGTENMWDPSSGISKGDWLRGVRPGHGGYHHMARGGPVQGGHSYLVGEKGPERYQDSNPLDQLGSWFFGQPRRPAPKGLPWMASDGSYWPSKADSIRAHQNSSAPALDRSISNLTAGIVAAIHAVSPQIHFAVTAADMQIARVTRSRIVKAHGSRGSLAGFGVS